MKAYKDVDSYLKDFPKEVGVLLKRMRSVIKKAAPDSKERISYGMPSYGLNGHLVFFGAFKDHISFFPGSGRTREFYKKELVKYKGGKGTIQFPLDKPIPYELVAKIVKFRVQENLAK